VSTDSALPDAPADVPSFQPLLRLTADLRAAARLLGRRQIRALVDLYYQVQEVRKVTANQRLAGAAAGEPNELVRWTADNWRRFEDDIKRAMLEFASSYRVGQWMLDVVGVGPVISAGLLVHLHPLHPTVGHWYSLAGLNPDMHWLGKERAAVAVKEAVAAAGSAEAAIPLVAKQNGMVPATLRRYASTDGKGNGRAITPANLTAGAARIPWNAGLKRLLFLTGDCFVKFSNHPKESYGTTYRQRKEYEQAKNERGDYRDQAVRSLADKNFGKDTEARRWYEQGKLPPARIHLRCQRYAVKMFLSHVHTVMWWDAHNCPPPVPYAFTLAGEDHRHYVPPPNFDPAEPFARYGERSLAALGE
jgi:hypothetical protein